MDNLSWDISFSSLLKWETSLPYFAEIIQRRSSYAWPVIGMARIG
jgi:hypothetical protein